MTQANYLKGLGSSFAKRQADGSWIVFGTHDILDDQQEHEYAYKANLPLEKLFQLDDETPIYAGVCCFKNGSNQTADYETVGDLKAIVQKILTDELPDTTEDGKHNYRLKDNLANNLNTQERLANTMFDGRPWYGLVSSESDIVIDIVYEPDAYPRIWEKVEN